MPPLLLLHLLTLFLFPAASQGDPANDTYDRNMCLQSNYTCGKIDIHYPFYLSNSTQELSGYSNSSYCAYPGMAIICEGDTATLQLSSNNSYTVQDINYDNYTVQDINYDNYTISLAYTGVFEGGDCPRVLRNVTIPSRPAPWPSLAPSPSMTNYYFFFHCALTPDFPKPPTIYEMACGNFDPGSEISFVLPEHYVPPKNLSQVCKEVWKVPVPRDSIPFPLPVRWGDDGYGGVLKRGFQLVWDSSVAAQCTQCEHSDGGQCGYNREGQFIGCFCPGGRREAQPCGRKGKNRRLVIGVSSAVGAGGAVALLSAAGVLAFYFRGRRQKKVTSSSKLLKNNASGGTPHSGGGDVESGSLHLQTHLFSYEELEEATDGFNDARELGDGGFGTVYKGTLRDGRVVAVKRLYNNSYRRVEQFVNEAAILSRLRHPNLVMFYGCTSSRSPELLLVYEFVPNGTVADHLHGGRAPERALTWPLRLNIAVESAAALAYLHAVEPPIVHRDVKTNNILLDADFHVKVADFGLSRLFPFDVTHVSTAPQGTPGYVDPEYYQCYQLTDKSDVYSFGVVLVELISSKPAVDITRQRNEVNLASLAINKIQKCQLDQLVDLELGFDSDPVTKKMMTMVAELAFRCLQQNGEMRPPIKEVLEALRGIQDEYMVVAPLSPDTVHAPWDSRTTTPNPSQ